MAIEREHAGQEYEATEVALCYFRAIFHMSKNYTKESSHQDLFAEIPASIFFRDCQK